MVGSVFASDAKRQRSRSSEMPKKRVQVDVPQLYHEKSGSSAAKAWAKTVRWRRENEVDAVASQFWDFDRVQRAYPHYVYGTTKANQVLVWEFVGMIDVEQLPSSDDVTDHFIFFHEFLGRRYHGEETRLVSVLDLEGLSYASLLNRRALEVLSTAASVAEQLVPFRLDVVAIRNAPRWFAFALANLPLPTAFKSKFVVLQSDDDLAQFFDGPPPTRHDLSRADDHRALLDLAKSHEPIDSPGFAEYDDDDDVFYDCQELDEDSADYYASSLPKEESRDSSPRRDSTSSRRRGPRRRRFPRAPRRVPSGRAPPVPRRACAGPTEPCVCRFDILANCSDFDDEAEACVPPPPPEDVPASWWWPATTSLLLGGAATTTHSTPALPTSDDLRSFFSYFLTTDDDDD
mmetsp:Transcript_1416/g.4824  ORF Transcript_1416/g.4824 Transcript_1416/m.4824 type:complete len:403 (-) Transcript_1416:188-1396(-)